MTTKEFDFKHHHEVFENSGLTIREYCAKAGIDLTRFKNCRYAYNKKLKAERGKFQSVDVSLQFTVSINDSGISIHSLSSSDLVRVIDALS